MKYLIYMIFLFTCISSKIIFNFSKNSDVQNWIIVDDVVMGGRSSSTFKCDTDGFGVFEGGISIENNGGFSSVRYSFKRVLIGTCTRIKINFKGDGKKYQLRIKSNSGDYYSYTTSFLTSGNWQEIEIPLKEMYPIFRGRKLNQANFSNSYIEQVSFLIANKKKERFKLLIDKIELI